MNEERRTSSKCTSQIIKNNLRRRKIADKAIHVNARIIKLNKTANS
jgi:hypothetical protein